MGLDMYARSVPSGQVADPEAQVDLSIDDDASVKDLAYWRKFNHLHGWMHDLYVAKGGVDPQFNCNTVRLTEEDLDKLVAAVEAGPLPSRIGFFFGTQEWEEGDKEEILEFVVDARKELAEGKIVFYTSWW